MLTDGTQNEFNNNVFDWHQWSAPLYETPEEIIAAFYNLGVCGKKLKSIYAIGAANNFEDSALSDLVFHTQYTAGIPFDDIQSHKYDFENNALVPCTAKICEPLILKFDDYSTFEIQPVSGNHIRMNVSSIPVRITDGMNHSNFDANKLFLRELRGASIRNFAIVIEKKDEQRFSFYKNGSNILSNNESRTQIRYVIEFDNGWCLYLRRKSEGWYTVELHHYCNPIETVPFSHLKAAAKPIRQAIIVEGHDGGACFWVMPVKQFDKSEEHSFGIEEFCQEEISIEEDDVYDFLRYFLYKYFDEDFEYTCRDGYTKCFEWNLEYNIYTYETMRNMIAEIQEKAQMLQTDFNNSALNEFKNPPRYYQATKNEVPSKLEKQEGIQEKLDVAIDFYERFCNRMNTMMDSAPEYDLISFMGP